MDRLIDYFSKTLFVFCVINKKEGGCVWGVGVGGERKEGSRLIRLNNDTITQYFLQTNQFNSIQFNFLLI